jgi:peptide/nickel transport system substrate-binding protein
MNLAIDRKAFVGTMLSPYVIIATQEMVPSISGHNPDLKPWPYDPERARKLIQEARAAGAPVDKEIMLYARSGHYAGQDEVLQSMIQMWQKVGMNIKLRMMENAQYNKLARKPYPEDVTARLITGKHDNAYGDAAFTMFFNYHSEGAKSDLSDPVLDKMLDDASALTGAKRRQLFQEANRYIYEKIVPEIMLYHLVSQIRVGPRVEYQPNMMTSGMIDLSEIKFKK